MDPSERIAFVDLQGFIVNKQFVLKELCFSISSSPYSHNTNSRSEFHFIYGPPFSWKYVNKADKIGIIWLTTYQHGLYWTDGCVPYKKVHNTIAQLCLSNSIIYVKGSQKIIWLKSLCNNENLDCRNIEDIGCNFRLADCAYTHLNCGSHKQNTKNCALRNVKLLRNWFYNVTKHQSEEKTNCKRDSPKCSEEFPQEEN